MSQNPDTPKTRLDHINPPARKPAWLAEGDAEQFGFQAKDGFVISGGTLLIFEIGEPLDYRRSTHFGYRCKSRGQARAWATKLDATQEEGAIYSGFKTNDPEGNFRQMYWEETA